MRHRSTPNFRLSNRNMRTNNLDGHIFSLFIIVIAAAEAAVGLAIVIRFFQIKETIHIDEATQLRN